MEPRTPTSRGTLMQRPLAHLLVYAYLHEMTGSFVLVSAASGAEATIVIAAGRPTKLKSTHEATYLGRVLLEMSAISQTEHDASLRELAKGGRLHGQILIDRGVLTPALLREGLASQLTRKLDTLFRLPEDATFLYYADVDLLEKYGGAEKVHIDPLARVWAGLREQPPWAHVDPALLKLRLGKLRIARNAQLDRLALRPEDRRLVDLLRIKPMHLDEIIANAESLGDKGARLLCYFLAITKQVDLVADVAAPSPDDDEEPSWVGPRGMMTGPPSSSGVHSAPPASSSKGDIPKSEPSSPRVVGRIALNKGRGGFQGIEETNASTTVDRRASPPPSELRTQNPDVIAARRRDIEEVLASLDQASFLTILSVTRDTPAGAVKDAFFALARSWHPDRLPKELVDQRVGVARIFARMSEAHATLTDETRRKKYLDALDKPKESADDQREIESVLEASLAFQKAEIALKRNDGPQAEELVRRARQLDPKQADYLALLAWLEATKPGTATTSEAVATKVAMLDEAVRLNERCERAYFYRGMLRKRTGNDAVAYLDFKKSMELNPRNIDAQREVRLYEMRTSSPPPAPTKEHGEKKGLFDRLFKKS